MVQLYVYMKTAALLAALSLTAVACAAAPSGDDSASSTANVTTAPAAASSALASGKYVVDGKILMIYGECSSQNFLGDSVQGAIDADGVMHSPEGDVCLGYKLKTTAPGEITVTWDQDPTAHLGADIEAGCKSLEGTYLQMEVGSFTDAKPGTYAKAGSDLTFVVPADCGTPATLYSADVDVAVFSSTQDKPFGFLQVEEGDVCGGYSYTAQKDGSVKITWQMPEGAHLGGDIETGCKSVEGVYKTK